MNLKILTYSIAFFCCAAVFGQKIDSTTISKAEIKYEKRLDRLRRDSIKQKPVDSLRKPHSVATATLLSAFIPGAGQIYNARAKKYYNQFKRVQDRQRVHWWWKVPVIYAGLGVSAYYIYKNDVEVKSLRTEYNNRIDNNISFSDPKYAQYDNTAILTIHDQYQTWRDISIVSFSLVYLLNVIDAAVEGHFVNFDISDDLSMNIQPTYIPSSNTFGLGLAFRFK